MTFEADASLKWIKNRTAITERQEIVDDKICGVPELSKVSVYKGNILAYI